MKKIISIFIVFIILISTVLTAPAHSLAVEVIGGTYVTYAILAAALAAAGYTVATADVSPEIFQGILDSPNSELVKALIGGTSMYLSAKGQVYFNWTASQWATFTNWANTYLSSGEFIVQVAQANTFVTDFVVSQISSYYETFIPSSTGIIGYQLGSNTVITLQRNSGYCYFQLQLDNAVCNSSNQSFPASSSAYYFGSPVYVNSQGIPALTIGWGLNAQNQVTDIRQDVVSVGNWITNTLTQWYAYNRNIYLSYWGSGHNQILATFDNGRYIAITNTANFPIVYNSLADYISDCISSGTLVGDWTGIGEDVINPGYPETEVGIDAYPDYQVGTGADAVPDVIDGTIDIPLDKYIDTPIDLSQDPVPIDFTPWQDKTIDTTPEDVIPDIHINPPADIPANPDIPWADDESYPLDYPIDTDTDDLPPGNNPNPDPSSDDKTNRLKLGPLLLSKFPFCLPWDLQHALKVLIAPAEAPVFTIPIVNQRLGINESLTIDLSFADRLAQITRWFLSALWVVILILITSKIIWK